MKKVIIIGAGPAGLTAGYDLLSKSSDYDVTIIEEAPVVGGLCARLESDENVLDAGGHMFISNNPTVKKFWNSILPAQGVPSRDDNILDRYCKIHNGGPDPETEEDVILSREKVTRIYKDNKFYENPIKFNKDAVKNFGIATSIKSGFSQIGGNVFKHKETSLEDYYINRFGKQLYSMFLEEYIEKIWGKEPSRIHSDWGVVAEKSLIAPIISTEKKDNRDYDKLPAPYAGRYYYPKYGAYQMWETVADRFIEMGGSIHKNCKVTGISTLNDKIHSVRCSADGDEFIVACDYLISTMPIRDLILGMDNVDSKICLAAENLSYRGMISICVELTEMKWKNDTTEYKSIDNIIPDSVVYISNPNVKVSRIQVYNNFSPYMIRNSEHYYLGLNYYCNEGDYYWSMGNRDWKKTVISDLKKLGIIDKEESVIGYNKTKYNKAFPSYYDGYESFDKIKAFLNKYENLYCIGRNGQHRFSSIDESMKTSFEAVKNILGSVTKKDNIWDANEKSDGEDGKSYNSALLSGEGEYRGNYVPLQKKIDSDRNEDKEYVPPRRMRRPMMTPIKKADPNKLSEPIIINDSVVIAARPEKSIPFAEPETDVEGVASVPTPAYASASVASENDESYVEFENTQNYTSGVDESYVEFENTQSVSDNVNVETSVEAAEDSAFANVQDDSALFESNEESFENEVKIETFEESSEAAEETAEEVTSETELNVETAEPELSEETIEEFAEPVAETIDEPANEPEFNPEVSEEPAEDVSPETEQEETVSENTEDAQTDENSEEEEEEEIDINHHEITNEFLDELLGLDFDEIKPKKSIYTNKYVNNDSSVKNETKPEPAKEETHSDIDLEEKYSVEAILAEDSDEDLEKKYSVEEILADDNDTDLEEKYSVEAILAEDSEEEASNENTVSDKEEKAEEKKEVTFAEANYDEETNNKIKEAIDFMNNSSREARNASAISLASEFGKESNGEKEDSGDSFQLPGFMKTRFSRRTISSRNSDRSRRKLNNIVLDENTESKADNKEEQDNKAEASSVNAELNENAVTANTEFIENTSANVAAEQTAPEVAETKVEEAVSETVENAVIDTNAEQTAPEVRETNIEETSTENTENISAMNEEIPKNKQEKKGSSFGKTNNFVNDPSSETERLVTREQAVGNDKDSERVSFLRVEKFESDDKVERINPHEQVVKKDETAEEKPRVTLKVTSCFNSSDFPEEKRIERPVAQKGGTPASFAKSGSSSEKSEDKADSDMTEESDVKEEQTVLPLDSDSSYTTGASEETKEEAKFEEEIESDDENESVFRDADDVVEETTDVSFENDIEDSENIKFVNPDLNAGKSEEVEEKEIIEVPSESSDVEVEENEENTEFEEVIDAAAENTDSEEISETVETASEETVIEENDVAESFESVENNIEAVSEDTAEIVEFNAEPEDTAETFENSETELIEEPEDTVESFENSESEIITDSEPEVAETFESSDIELNADTESEVYEDIEIEETVEVSEENFAAETENAEETEFEENVTFEETYSSNEEQSDITNDFENVTFEEPEERVTEEVITEEKKELSDFEKAAAEIEDEEDEEEDDLLHLNEQAASRSIVKSWSNRYNGVGTKTEQVEKNERVVSSGSISNDLYGEHFSLSQKGKKGFLDHMLDDLDGGKEYVMKNQHEGKAEIKEETKVEEKKENVSKDLSSYQIVKETKLSYPEEKKNEPTLKNVESENLKSDSISPSPVKQNTDRRPDYFKKEIDTSIVFKNARVIKTTKITKNLEEEINKKPEKKETIFSDKQKVIAVIRNGEVIPVNEEKKAAESEPIVKEQSKPVKEEQPKTSKKKNRNKRNKNRKDIQEPSEDIMQAPISVMLDAKEAAEMTELPGSPIARTRNIKY